MICRLRGCKIDRNYWNINVNHNTEFPPVLREYNLRGLVLGDSNLFFEKGNKLISIELLVIWFSLFRSKTDRPPKTEDDRSHASSYHSTFCQRSPREPKIDLALG